MLSEHLRSKFKCHGLGGGGLGEAGISCAPRLPFCISPQLLQVVRSWKRITVLFSSNEGVPCVERVKTYAVVHWNPCHHNIRGKIHEAVRKKTQVCPHFENYDEPKAKLMST
jgi:hypothetical protein